MANFLLRLFPYFLKLVGWLSPSLAGEIALRRFTSPIHFPRPGWESELMQKGRALSFANGTRATIWGEGQAPIVLLVHGWAGRGAQLGKLVEPILGLGFRVVGWDAPAHGDSSGERVNLRIFAEKMAEVVTELGPVKCVVAHSFGAGATTLALARGWMKAERVVLVAAPSDLEWVVQSYCRRLKMSATVARVFRERLERWAGFKTGEVGIAYLAKSLEVPALIAHDPEDEDVPYSNGKTIAVSWRGSRLVTLTGVGHRKILKAPSFVEAVLKFLRE